ncbi:hypothetical protein BXY85_0246 [Roseivirga pacifica]|uniref:VLRF1 domain-containing protein n=1 Tax=Roseivirga pacifica TaxID=1267423 RepID=A0A1I0R9B7_9BACT|nr:hypothetical protein [Roseivirga pacifica]RKQ49257.1 hypothetical protein BXY85_0246 [Roseivirga pacifica]SEW37417.1 hypothetical protein SAMN05216290_3299 [Roseivirga pacifica]
MDKEQSQTVIKSKNEIIEVTHELTEKFGQPGYDFAKHELLWEGEEGEAKLRLPVSVTVSESAEINWDAEVTYLMLIVQTGMATLGVFQNEKCLSHKVFSAYMVRKKQGKSQIKYLKTKGKSRAGSRVRLASGQEFFGDVNERLQTYFNEYEFDRILYSISKILVPHVFDAKYNTPFGKQDTRLLKISRHVEKPTHEEMIRSQRFMNMAELKQSRSESQGDEIAW